MRIKDSSKYINEDRLFQKNAIIKRKLKGNGERSYEWAGLQLVVFRLSL